MLSKRSLIYFLSLVMLILFSMGIASTAYSAARICPRPVCVVGAIDLTGGLSDDLDSIDGARLAAGDYAFVVTTTDTYFYKLQDGGCGGESSPDTIIPDYNPGSKCWIKIDEFTNIEDLQNVTGVGTDAQVLISDGTDLNPVTFSGGATVDNTGVVQITLEGATGGTVADDIIINGSLKINGAYAYARDVSGDTNVLPSTTAWWDSNRTASDVIEDCDTVNDEIDMTGHPFTTGQKVTIDSAICDITTSGDYWVCPGGDAPNAIKLDTDYGTDYTCDTYLDLTTSGDAGEVISLVEGNGLYLAFGTTCTFANDTSDFLTGIHSPKATGVNSDICSLVNSSRLAAAIDLTSAAGYYLKVAFKASDYSDFISSDSVFNFGDSTNGLSAGNLSTVKISSLDLVEGVAGDKDDKWQTVLLPTAGLTYTDSNADETDIDAISFNTITGGSSYIGNFLIDEISYMALPTNGIVIVTFDDGNGYDYQAAQYMAQYGYIGTSFIVTDKFDSTNPVTTAPTLTVAQAEIMRDQFLWEFGLHGDHTDYSIKTADQVAQNISENIAYIRSNGFVRGTDVFAFPGGEFSEVAKDALKPYVKAARIYSTATGETVPPADYYEIKTYTVLTGTTLATIQGWVDNAVDDKQVTILIFHGVPKQAQIVARGVGLSVGQVEYCFDAACTAAAGTSNNYFTQVIDYLNTKSATVLSLSDFISTVPR